MFMLLKKLYHGYHFVFNDLADPRSLKYPLMSSPLPVIGICAVYLYFVLKIGPKLMENRKPFNIHKIIIVFNIAQIVACAFLVIEFMRLCFFRFNWFCEPIDYSNDELPVTLVFYAWVYFAIKVLDLCDTIFFVLRKKYTHLSFLHLYHHTGMVLLTWFGCKFIPGGHGIFVGFANCIVHTFMYFYYLMTIWDARYKRSVWWKKYITQLQMAQFFFLMIMFTQLFFQPSCTYPKWVPMFFVPQNIFMFVLFADFYYKAYIVKKEINTPETTTENKEEQFVESVANSINENKDEQKSK